MSKEKVSGKLSPETRQKLELCAEMVAKDAVDLVTEAYGQNLFEQKGRGDKVWLYKGAKEALTVMEKLKRVLIDDEQTTGNTDQRKVTPEQQAMELLANVTKKLEERKKQRPS